MSVYFSLFIGFYTWKSNLVLFSLQELILILFADFVTVAQQKRHIVARFVSAIPLNRANLKYNSPISLQFNNRKRIKKSTTIFFTSLSLARSLALKMFCNFYVFPLLYSFENISFISWYLTNIVLFFFFFFSALSLSSIVWLFRHGTSFIKSALSSITTNGNSIFTGHSVFMTSCRTKI